MASHSVLSEDLVRACVGSHDEAAWAEFIRLSQPMIAKVVGRTAGRHWSQAPRHLVDDLIQETYLRLCGDDCRLLRKFQFRHHDSIYGFLKVVAVSVVIDYFKSERARKRDINQTEPLSEHSAMDRPTNGGGSLLPMEEQVALRQIDEVVTKLFTGEILVRNRAIFWLNHRDGMTAQAIASIPWIGLNTKGVETVLRRMTQMIQSHIGTFR